MKKQVKSRVFALSVLIHLLGRHHLISSCRVKLSTLAIVTAALFAPPSSFAWSQTTDPAREFHEAIAAQQSGDYAKALKGYEFLVQRYPRNIAVRTNLAGLLVDLGRLEEAIMNYRSALEVDPSKLDLHFGLDAALIDKNDSASLKTAAADLELLHTEIPNDLTATKLLGEVYDHQQRYAKVIELLGPIETSSNKDDDLEFLLGGAMVQGAQLVEGVSRLDQVALRTGRADAYLAAGHARLSMSQFDQAKKDAEAALNKQPDLADAETLLGSVLERMGDYEGASAALQKALAQDSEDFDANYNLGSLEYFTRDLPSASLLLERALHLRPSSSEARYKLALVQQSCGETQAALINLERVTRDRPDWMEPHAKLSASYFQAHRPADGEREARLLEALVTKGMLAKSPRP